MLQLAEEDPRWEVTPEQLVKLMDESKVHKLFLTAWCRPSGWVVTNDEIARFTTQFPDRFVGKYVFLCSRFINIS